MHAAVAAAAAAWDQQVVDFVSIIYVETNAAAIPAVATEEEAAHAAQVAERAAIQAARATIAEAEAATPSAT